jgi:acetate kinase
MKILVMNAGSSSQKSCLYEMGDGGDSLLLWEAKIDWTHHQDVAELKVKTRQGKESLTEIPQKSGSQESGSQKSRSEAIALMLETLWQGETKVIENFGEIDMVGHRVVHGGRDYQSRVRITNEVKAAIARLSNLAPDHNPANLEGIESVTKILGKEIPQVAVFDTAFHSQIPQSAAIYPVPSAWQDLGIRRYGFHGISHQYCAQKAAEILGRADLRLISCHLGNGCSLAAIRNGISIDTTMGFTPLEGLMMGSRSGSIDPSILIYLQREHGYSYDRLDHELNKASGLLGVSGVSADMRAVLEAIATENAQANSEAKLALAIYIHRLRSGLGSMVMSLGGVDAVVFTAGVGENSARVRELACESLEFLGIKLDLAKNSDQNHNSSDRNIATDDSTVQILVIHTQEDLAIARECWEFARNA